MRLVAVARSATPSGTKMVMTGGCHFPATVTRRHSVGRSRRDEHGATPHLVDQTVAWPLT